MKKLKMRTPDGVDENIKKIMELFPNCVVEAWEEGGIHEGGSHQEPGQGQKGQIQHQGQFPQPGRIQDSPLRKCIDFDILRQELSGYIVDGPRERYQLNWPGKREALLAANAPIAKTLRPCREESVDFDTTKNLFIEGDNLDALKLLQETYLNKVKMIYIDPPYNTGNDFVYDDDFKEDTETYFKRSNQKDETGNRMVANTEANGRFHSDWLSMMYPRLKLARNLLKEDGVIFISVDDNEVHNLRKMCDEILGAENFIAGFPRITKKAGKSTNQIAKNNDYILSFQKSTECELNSYFHSDDGFKHSDQYESIRGKYKLNQTLDYGSIQYSSSLDYEIEIEGHILRPGNASKEEMEDRKRRNPSSDFCWRWSKDLYQFGLENGFIVLKESNSGFRIYTKTYKNATISKSNLGYYVEKKIRTKSATTLDFVENLYSNDNSRKDMGKLFEKKVFAYSKPVSLIKTLSFLSTDSNDIIIDFFSGSATTAHAVIALNAEDGGNRKFIMVQLPENCDEKSETFKAGYKTIAEIGKERIRRAGKKITTEYTENIEKKKGLFNNLSVSSESSVVNKLDIGFRVLKIDNSNMKDVYYSPDAVKQDDLFDYADNIREDRTPEDLLFQVLLDWGVDLSLPITQETIGSKTVFFVDENAMAACFEPDISEEMVKELAARKPLRVVFRDSGFTSDSVKINVEQIFKLISPGTEVKVI